MKYFGTDGIRGIVCEDINERLLKKIAKAIVCFYNKNKLKPILLVGNDTRISSDYILTVLNTILLKHGVETHNLGECSSPCLAYLTKKHHYPLGLMISASHNPKEYNGLKFFNSNGEKVNDSWEEEFEKYMELKKSLPIKFTTPKNVHSLKNDYMNFLKSNIKNKSDFIFDCANGGVSEIVKQVFPKCEIINANPNGENINLNSGCTNIDFLKRLCQQNKKIGFAFDGDGDRISVVDSDGEIYDGDKILNIFSKFYQNKGDTLVGTIYTNSALENSLHKRNIKLIRAQVGDKKVYEQMLKHNSILGGEESGHIIVKTFTNTGDGILNSILIANILKISNLTLRELNKDYSYHYQKRANLKINPSFNISNIQNDIKEFEKQGARIIIRPSGTEPVLRLFAEHKNEEIAEKFLKNIENLIKNQEN